MDDGEPTDQADRREYVARVAGFFHDIMQPKLESMIAAQHNEMATVTNSRETDLFIKANINAFSLLLDWGDACESEHLDNIKNPTNQPEDTT